MMASDASAAGKDRDARTFLKSRLAYHLRALRQDATDPAMTNLERLALVRERVARVREIRRALAATTGNPC